MRILLIILILGNLFLTGCQNNDGPTSSRIARSWQNETSTVLSVASGQSTVTYKRGVTGFEAWMNLAPDGTYTGSVDGKISTGTWQLVDKQLKITVPGSSIPIYEVENISAKNLTLLYVVPANPQDSNQKAFLSTLKNGFGVDISKGVTLTIQHSAR